MHVSSIATTSQSTQVFDNISDGENEKNLSPVKPKKSRASVNKPPPAVEKNDKTVNKRTKSQINHSTSGSNSDNKKIESIPNRTQITTGSNSRNKKIESTSKKTQVKITRSRRQLSQDISVTPASDILETAITDSQEPWFGISNKDNSSVATKRSSSSEDIDPQRSSLHTLTARNSATTSNTRRAKRLGSTRTDSNSTKRQRIEDKVVSKPKSQTSVSVVDEIATRTRSTVSKTEEAVKSPLDELLDYPVKKVHVYN